jgi:hypothetical protein
VKPVGQCLFWDGVQGYAARGCRKVTLGAAPQINGQRVAQVQYVPTLGVASVRRSWHAAERTMRDDEVAEIRAHMDRLLGGAQ